MKLLKQSQKVRIIVSGVAIYTTVKQIRYGLFGFANQNLGANQALAALESARRTDSVADRTVGLAGTWSQLQIQLDIL
jgi:hypothetical protein